MVALMECIIVGLEYQGLYLRARDNDTRLAIVPHEANYPWVAPAYFGEEFGAEGVRNDLAAELCACPFVYGSWTWRGVWDHRSKSYPFA